MIRRIVEERGIAQLCHFTRLENLSNILANGLIPRLTLYQDEVSFVYNDYDRIDGYIDASCLSITFPNYKMFYRLRKANPGHDWVVIKFKPEVLWENQCAFCVANASCNSVTCIPIEERMGHEAFVRIFDEIPGMATRQAMGLTSKYPTNPQAEILVFGVVAPTKIINVNFMKDKNIHDTEKVDEIIDAFPGYDYYTNESIFKYRHDFAHW